MEITSNQTAPCRATTIRTDIIGDVKTKRVAVAEMSELFEPVFWSIVYGNQEFMALEALHKALRAGCL